MTRAGRSPWPSGATPRTRSPPPSCSTRRDGWPRCTPAPSRRRTCAPSSTGSSGRREVGETFSSLVTDGPLLVAAGVAALVGLISFASPCVLPLVPGYLAYVSGLVGTGDVESDEPSRGGAGTPVRPRGPPA